MIERSSPTSESMAESSRSGPTYSARALVSICLLAICSIASAQPVASRTVGSWDEALSLLRTSSPDLRIAYDQTQQAAAQILQALSPLLTTVAGQVTVTHNFITGESALVSGITPVGAPIFSAFSAPTPTYVQASLQVTQPIVSVQGWHALATARVSEEAARLSFTDLKRTLTIRLASTLIAVSTSTRIADLNRLALRDALTRAALVTTRERLGGGTGLDSARAREDVAAARSAVVVGDEALQRAREALGLALGLAEAVGVREELRLEQIEAGAFRACRALESIDTRPDIVAANKRALAAKRNVTDAYEQFLPTIVGQGLAAITTYDTGAAPNKTLAVQGSLNIPLWDGGSRLSVIRNARALADASEQQVELLRRTAAIELSRAHRDVDVAEQSRSAAKDVRDNAADVDRISRAAYALGQGTSLDLFVAAVELRRADVSLAVLDYDVVRARIGAELSSARCTW